MPNDEAIKNEPVIGETPPAAPPAPAVPIEPAAPAEPSVEDFDSAAGFLKDTGVPADVISGLSKQAVVDWAVSQVPDPDAISDPTAAAPATALDSRLDQITARLEKAAAGPEPAAPESVSTAKLAESVGEEAAAEITTLRKQMSDQSTAVRTLAVMMEGDAIRRGIKALQGDYPQLKKAETLAVVRKKAAALLGTGEYDSIDEAFEDACVVVCREPRKEVGTAPEDESRLDRLRRLKSKASPSATPRRETAATPTREEKADAVGKLIVAGKPEEAAKLAGARTGKMW